MSNAIQVEEHGTTRSAPSDEIVSEIHARKASLAVRIPVVMEQIEQAFAPAKSKVEARLAQAMVEPGARRGKFIKVNEILADVRAISSIHAACRAGCSACCTQRVQMSQTEADAIGYKIGRMPVQLRADYVSPEIDSFGPETPCTFLSSGACTIYDDRPFACRNCAFHAKWPPVPRQTGHPVHAKLSHSFHAMADSRSVATRGVSFYYV